MFKMLGDKNTAVSRYLSTKTDVHLCLDMVNELHERMVAFKKHIIFIPLVILLNLHYPY